MSSYQKLNFEIQTFRNPYKGRLVSNNTRVYKHHDGSNRVKFHNTDILCFYLDGTIKVSNGCWQTRTTKSRINQYLPYNLNVFSNKGSWVISDGSFWYEFENHMIIASDGALSVNKVKMPKKMYRNKLMSMMSSLGLKSVF